MVNKSSTMKICSIKKPLTKNMNNIFKIMRKIYKAILGTAKT